MIVTIYIVFIKNSIFEKHESCQLSEIKPFNISQINYH